METPKPYNDIKQGNTIYRVFDADTDPNELVWHRDRRNRRIEILECDNWYMQYDNQLPKIMKVGDFILIESNKYHRVLKGNGALKIKITEYGRTTK
jgi:hypothetical protein